MGCSVWLFYSSALNLIFTTRQGSGKVSSLNLAKQPLAEIQTCLRDICPSTGLFLLCVQDIQDWWCELVLISDYQDLSSQRLFALRRPNISVFCYAYIITIFIFLRMRWRQRLGGLACSHRVTHKHEGRGVWEREFFFPDLTPRPYAI